MINYLGDRVTLGAPATTTNIVAGLYINRPPTTTFAGVNLSLSGITHSLGIVVFIIIRL